MRVVLLVGAACVGALTFALPIAANAAPLEHERYLVQFTDTFTDTECGAPITIDYVAEGAGVFMLKVRRNDPTPYYFDNYNLVETFTNTANGKTLTVIHQGLFKDQRIEHIEGSLYRITTQETGRPVVAYGPDGRPFVFDRGLVRVTWLVDTKGDSDPSNDDFLEVLGDSTAGPHPVFEGADFCDALELIR